jgi:hypothetical protein
MDFGEAIKLLKNDSRVARDGWNGKGMWLSLSGTTTPRYIEADKFWSRHSRDFALTQPDQRAKVLPCILMKNARGEIVMGWLASQEDILAEDWVCVPDAD